MGLESGQPRIQPSVLNYARIPNGTLGLRALGREALLDPLWGAPSLTAPRGDPACIRRDEVRSSAAANSQAGPEGGLRWDEREDSGDWFCFRHWWGKSLRSSTKGKHGPGKPLFF